MINRLKLAISKLIFCYRVSLNWLTFIKLLWNTKRLALSQKKQPCLASDAPSYYKFRLNGVQKNVYLRTHAGDIAIFYEIFWSKVYQRFPINYSELKTIIDVGANVGLASIFFHSLSPQAQIFAVEPDHNNVEVLAKNINCALYSKRIKAIEAAVSSFDCVLYLKTKRFAFNTFIDEDQQGEMVKGISLNSLIKSYNLQKIDLLKIDVEGFEHKIFSSDIDWLDKVVNIIIEIHSAKDYAVCIETLVQRGFVIQSAIPKSTDQENIYWAYKK